MTELTIILSTKPDVVTFACRHPIFCNDFTHHNIFLSINSQSHHSKAYAKVIALFHLSTLNHQKTDCHITHPHETSVTKSKLLNRKLNNTI